MSTIQEKVTEIIQREIAVINLAKKDNPNSAVTNVMSQQTELRNIIQDINNEYDYLLKMIKGYDAVLKGDDKSRNTNLEVLKSMFTEFIQHLKYLDKLPDRFISLKDSIGSLTKGLIRVRNDLGLNESAFQAIRTLNTAVKSVLDKLQGEIGSFAEQNPLEIVKQLGGRI